MKITLLHSGPTKVSWEVSGELEAEILRNLTSASEVSRLKDGDRVHRSAYRGFLLEGTTGAHTVFLGGVTTEGGRRREVGFEVEIRIAATAPLALKQRLDETDECLAARLFDPLPTVRTGAPAFAPAAWAHFLCTNCYAYAIDRQVECTLIPGFAESGILKGQPSVKEMTARLVSDGLRPFKRPGDVEPQERGHFVAAFLGDSWFFHFFRQDQGGNWSSKLRNESPRQDLGDPRSLDNDCFSGFFWLPADKGEPGKQELSGPMPSPTVC